MFLIPEVRALAVVTLSQPWQGQYMFAPIPLLIKVIKKLQGTQEGEFILLAPFWPSQPFPHLTCLDCVWSNLKFYRTAKNLLSHRGYGSHTIGRKSYLDGSPSICKHGGACTCKQQDSQKRFLFFLPPF